MTAPTPTLTPRFLVLLGFVAAAAAARLLPHAWNFTPVEAMALFGGAYFASRWAAFAVPLGALFVSDLFLGMHSLIPVVYACVAVSVLLGFALRGRVGVLRIAGCGLAGSLVFFLVTNFAVWATGGGHPACQTGLMACYAIALPFLKPWLLGTAVWSLVLFGGFELLRRRLPALDAGAVAARA